MQLLCTCNALAWCRPASRQDCSLNLWASRFAMPACLKGSAYESLIDQCMQAAPYDFLEADDDLSQDQVDTARAQMGMWTSEGCYPLLPYSSVVLEAVPEQQSQTGRARAASQARQVQNHSMLHRRPFNSAFVALALKVSLMASTAWHGISSESCSHLANILDIILW